MLFDVRGFVGNLTGGRLHAPSAESRDLLAKVPMFSALDPKFVATVARCLQSRAYAVGSEIIDPSADSRDLYLIRSGTVRIEIESTTGDKHVVNLTSGSFIGDINLLSDLRAHVSASAVTDCELLVLTRGRFDRLTREHPGLGEGIWQSFKAAVLVDVLAKVPLLSTLSRDELVRLAYEFEWRTSVGGTALFLQADYGNEFYVIHRGMARVIVTQPDGSKVERRLYEGDFFGELALLGDSERRATVRAGTDLKTFVLRREAFLDVVNRFPELREHMETEQKKYVLPKRRGISD
jgi:CRP-like cAMP-binding protein